jgi:hypothetical protein
MRPSVKDKGVRPDSDVPKFINAALNAASNNPNRFYSSGALRHRTFTSQYLVLFSSTAPHRKKLTQPRSTVQFKTETHWMNDHQHLISEARPG